MPLKQSSTWELKWRKKGIWNNYTWWLLLLTSDSQTWLHWKRDDNHCQKHWSTAFIMTVYSCLYSVLVDTWIVSSYNPHNWIALLGTCKKIFLWNHKQILEIVRFRHDGPGYLHESQRRAVEHIICIRLFYLSMLTLHVHSWATTSKGGVFPQYWDEGHRWISSQAPSQSYRQTHTHTEGHAGIRPLPRLPRASVSRQTLPGK